jgi:hypothetical protein
LMTDQTIFVAFSHSRSAQWFHELILVEMMWVELTSIHSNSDWCELYCGFSKV